MTDNHYVFKVTHFSVCDQIIWFRELSVEETGAIKYVGAPIVGLSRRCLPVSGASGWWCGPQCSAEEGAEAPRAAQRRAGSGPSALTLPLLGSKASFTSRQEVLQEMAEASHYSLPRGLVQRLSDTRGQNQSV